MTRYRFAHRMQNIPESFLERLFAVSRDPLIISFAGGLPGSDHIDVEGISTAAHDVLAEHGREALQYSTTDGYLPLREYIAGRYRDRLSLPARADMIQIVNGSQQCLDLMGKIFLEKGSPVGMESPGYLGAIEAFSLYEPDIHTVRLEEDGPDPGEFAALLDTYSPRFFYGIPNCQNPSGRTYSQQKRKDIAALLEISGTVFYEDDAFGELFFDGKPRRPVSYSLPEQSVLSGSFSKIVAPGMRIGWIYAPEPILKQFNIVKQAADLHSNFLCQMIMHRYLTTHDLDRHLRTVVGAYEKNCRLMCDLLDDLFPADMSHSTPEGGMFMIATLPPGISSMEVFEEGVRQNVAILPGFPFFAGTGGNNMIRLNFSNADEEKINEGMHRLARVVNSLAG